MSTLELNVQKYLVYNDNLAIPTYKPFGSVSGINISFCHLFIKLVVDYM